jgi:lipopolysaccharide export system permease protein
MIGRLDRYVGGIYLSCLLLALVFFVGLFGVVDFFAKVGDLLDHARASGGGAAIIGQFYLCQAPRILKEVAPFVMLMAALLTVLRLQRHNELMAMQLTGRSLRRALMPVFVLSAVFTGVLAWVQERVAPGVAVKREQLEAQLLKGKTDWIIDAIHMRDARGWLFSAHGVHVYSGIIDKLHVSGRDEKDRNVSVSGSEARWDDEAGGWRVEGGVREVRSLPAGELLESGEAEVIVTDVRPEDLLMEHRQAFDLSYGEILDRSERYPTAPGYRLLRHYHVTYPLSVLLLVVLGVPFVLRRPERRGFVGVGAALLLCVGFMLVDATVRDLGNHGFLHPVVAAWLPVILAGSLGVVLLDSVDD